MFFIFLVLNLAYLISEYISLFWMCTMKYVFVFQVVQMGIWMYIVKLMLMFSTLLQVNGCKRLILKRFVIFFLFLTSCYSRGVIFFIACFNKITELYLVNKPRKPFSFLVFFILFGRTAKNHAIFTDCNI